MLKQLKRETPESRAWSPKERANLSATIRSVSGNITQRSCVSSCDIQMHPRINILEVLFFNNVQEAKDSLTVYWAHVHVGDTLSIHKEYRVYKDNITHVIQYVSLWSVTLHYSIFTSLELQGSNFLLLVCS